MIPVSGNATDTFPCPCGCALASVVHVGDGQEFLRCRQCSLLARVQMPTEEEADRKSTRLNSSHLVISYAVFCLKKKKHLLDGNLPPHAVAMRGVCRSGRAPQ